jgi:diguanylate cyclase (GGDEF)-like protein
MELKIYLRTLLKKWWVILPVFLITFTATVVFTFTQASTYEAVATMIVAPAGSVGDVRGFANNLDILSSRTQIASTYAEVASSRSVRQEATQALNLSPDQAKSLIVGSKLRAGTNVLEITVEGNDPIVVADFANKVGEKTMAYAQKLYESYSVTTLDPARPPIEPIKPDRKLNLALGAMLGLALGVGLAFLSEYMQSPLENMMNLGILDEETGAYNKRYFAQRLGEEMIRAKRNRYPLSLALMNVDDAGVMRTSLSPQFRSEALRKVTVFLKQYLREEDVMSRLDGTTFAFLLPDMPESKAKVIMEKLQTRVAWTAFEMEKSGVKLNLSGAAGIVAYNYNGTSQAELLEKAGRALQLAETAGYGKVFALSEENGDHHNEHEQEPEKALHTP